MNGAFGVDFNAADLAAEDFAAACGRLAESGTRRFLPTVITDALPAMEAKVRQLAALCESHAAAVGLHVEGPFLNPSGGTAGAHPRDSIVPADLDAAKRLYDAAGGRLRVFTLAPECDAGLAVTRWLADRGVVVSAGHTDASRDRLLAAADAGLSMVTHVGNGCSQKLPRHDNIVQRAISLSGRLWCCFIADGVHVPAWALRNYIRAAGVGRTVIVSDAMAAAGLGDGRYGIGGVRVNVRGDRAELAGGDGRLAGSVATADRLRTVLREIGFGAEADRMMRANPAAALGLEDAV